MPCFWAATTSCLVANDVLNRVLWTEQSIERDFRFIRQKGPNYRGGGARRRKGHCGVKLDTLTKLDIRGKFFTSDKPIRSVKMSTKERYGTAVWEALVAIHEELKEGDWGWHSAGQVARRAGVSTTTARKYLDLMYEMGKVRSIGLRGTGYFYQPILAK